MSPINELGIVRGDFWVVVMLSQRASVSVKGPSTCRCASRDVLTRFETTELTDRRAQVAGRHQALPRRICYGDTQALGRRHEARAGPLGAHGVRFQPVLFRFDEEFQVHRSTARGQGREPVTEGI